MYFHLFLFIIAFLSLTQSSLIPDQVYDENTDLCLSRREESGFFDYSEIAPEDSLFGNLDPEPLSYELSNVPPGSGLSNEDLEPDLDLLSYDFAALPLDTDPTDSSGRRKGACSANSNSLPSGFELLSPIPANPFIPSCESEYPFTLCCKGIPVPSPGGSANLGSEVLALPNLDNPDGIVNVGECIFCNFFHWAF